MNKVDRLTRVEQADLAAFVEAASGVLTEVEALFANIIEVLNQDRGEAYDAAGERSADTVMTAADLAQRLPEAVQNQRGPRR